MLTCLFVYFAIAIASLCSLPLLVNKVVYINVNNLLRRRFCAAPVGSGSRSGCAPVWPVGRQAGTLPHTYWQALVALCFRPRNAAVYKKVQYTGAQENREQSQRQIDTERGRNKLILWSETVTLV